MKLLQPKALSSISGGMYPTPDPDYSCGCNCPVSTSDSTFTSGKSSNGRACDCTGDKYGHDSLKGYL